MSARDAHLAGRCSQRVGDGRGNRWQCERKAKVARNGDGYCKQHDPLARAERAAAATALRIADADSRAAKAQRWARVSDARDAVIAAAKRWAAQPFSVPIRLEDQGLALAVVALDEAEASDA